MKRIVLALVAIASFSAVAGLSDALDCDALEFTTGGDAQWFEQSDVVKTGQSALRSGAITDNQETWIEVVASNAGMLSFWWRASSEYSYDMITLTVAGVEKATVSGTSGEWERRSAIVSAGQAVRWCYSKDGSASEGSDCGWLDGIEFEKAPEKMTVTFETNGGSSIEPQDVTPGALYGDLPRPESSGEAIFAGWYLNEELTEKALDNDPVAFRDITLYAKWSLPVSLLDTECLTFGTNSDDYSLPWEAVEDEDAAGGYALRGPVDAYRTGGYVWVDFSGAGTFEFKWKADGASGYSLGRNFQVDGESDNAFTAGGYKSGVWNTYKVCLYDGESDHNVQWYSADTRGALMLKDITWTPAPDEIAVSFDANGGTVAASQRVYSPGETYARDGDEPLPVPVRSGYTFLGWRLNAEDGPMVSASERVALDATVVLVAKWGKAVPASMFNTKTIAKLKQTGAHKWYSVDVPGIGSAAEVELKGKTGEQCFYSCGEQVCQEGLVATTSTLQATTTAAGYLSFAWSLKNGGPLPPDDGIANAITTPYIDFAFYLDGYKMEDGSLWMQDESTGERTAHIYIPPGTHTLKWEATGRPAWARYYTENRYYDEDAGEWIYDDGEEHLTVGSPPAARIWGFSFEAAGPQPDLAAWSGKLKAYKSWRTGDMARFAAAYKTRMIANPDDYEARILFAATRLGVLAENKQFTTYAKTFGFTVDWMRMSVTPPKPRFDKKSAAVNTMVDKTIALASPAIKEAKEALAGIPENWEGSVTLDPETWPVDEAVSIDCADVLFARAGLDAALAGLDFLGAYDLTVNWPKVDAAVKLTTKIPAVKSVPKIDDSAAWEKGARCFRTVATARSGTGGSACAPGEPLVEETSPGTGAMAVNGNSLLLRLAYDFGEGFLNETNQINYFDFYLKSGGRKLNIWGDVYGENGREAKMVCYVPDGGSGQPVPPVCEYGQNTVPRNYATQTNVYCNVYDSASEDSWVVPATIQLRDGMLLLDVNLAKVNLGTKKKPVKFSSKSWSVAYGEIGTGVWLKDDYNYTFEVYPEEWYDEESGEWVEPYWDEHSQKWVGLNPMDDPADYQPVYEYHKRWTGGVEWHTQSVAERRAMKYINDQTSLFSKVRDATRLGASRRHLKAALERALVADGKALGREEGGDMHFFEYDPANKAMIDFARANTSRALEALDSPTAVDFPAVAAEWDATGITTNRFLASECNYTLLPDEGLVRIYLGALFEGGVDRSLMPPMRTNAYGEVVPDFDAMRDPTIGGLIPDMTHDHIAGLTGRFESKRELDHGEPEDVEALPKPGEKLSFSYPQYKGYAASGLPKGWTWNAKTGELSGTASTSFKATFTKKSKPTAAITVEVGPRPAALFFSDDEDAVVVTGTGLYNVGATVKAVAAVKSGYAFAGWYDASGAMVFAGASYSFKMPREGVSLEARTLPLAEDALYAKTAIDYYLEPGESVSLTPFTVMSGTPYAVSASGLPAGLSASHEMAQDLEGGFSGDTVVSGAPVEIGVYYATFSAKNNGGFRWVHVVRFVVGEVHVGEVNAAGLDFRLLDPSRPCVGVECAYSFEVPPAADGSAVKSVSVKGLPGGFKSKYSSGVLQIWGVPATPGKFTLTATVAYANKRTAKTVKTFAVDDMGSVYIPTGIVANDPAGNARGTVTGGGVKHYGQSLKFTAAAADKKKLFFAGWYLDSCCELTADEALPGTDWQLATVSPQLTAYWSPGDGMYARFATKAEEADQGIDILCDDFWRVLDAESGETASLEVGWHSATRGTLTASGLPKGTALSGGRFLVVTKPAVLVPGDYMVTLTLKTAAGNVAKKQVAVLVPNLTAALDAEVLEGLYTGDDGYTSMTRSFMQAGTEQSFTLEDLSVSVADGWTLAVSGLPKGWTYNAKTGTFSGIATKPGRTFVTFTVSKKVSKKVTSYKATSVFDLDPLPSWTAGTFVGMVGSSYLRMDVTDGGVISGYLIDAAGGRKTFAATGLATEYGESYSTTLKGKGVSLPVTIGQTPNLGSTQGVAEFADGTAWGSMWSDAYAEPLPVFAAGAQTAIDVGKNTLTMKFGAKGAVTCTYKAGKNSTSGSTQICAIEWDADEMSWTADIAVALAPKKSAKGGVLVPALVKTFRVLLPADDEGTVVAEDIQVQPLD